ncbi:serine--tRNA ligase [Candidatus Woesearchaeota archaeon]|nr:serine--tRNA ligase [Candidatus Woesearchaeota archaeon]
MLDINLIREKPQEVKKNLAKRKDPELLTILGDIIEKDAAYRQMKYDLQKFISQKNTISKEVGELKKQGKNEEAAEKLAEMKKLPEKVEREQAKLDNVHQEINQLLHRLPNLLHESVPYGKDSTQNVVVRKYGKISAPGFPLLNHVEIAEKLDLADFDRANKIAGAGFFFLKNELALLDQALARFAVDHLIKKGYTFIETPLMMKRKPYEGVTDLADFENVMYKIEGQDAYLIATSEHPLVAMFMDETIDEEKLPLKFVGLSQCFRKEIGSHGIDEKGLFRRHQFTKVEQLMFAKPEESWKLHEEIVATSEEIWQALGIPYHVINICTGDIGVVAAKKYDIEAWMPRTKEYKEIVSASHCTDYQARRLNIRCGKEGGQKRVLHTLNGTAIATSRALVAILENYQNKDGSITIPEVLVPYMNGLKKIQRKK